MKGYYTESGYMGYVDGRYMLFASEDDYRFSLRIKSRFLRTEHKDRGIMADE